MSKQVRNIILVSAAVVILIVLLDALYVVSETNQVIVTQFGEPSPERDERMKRLFQMHAQNEEFELGEAFYRIDMQMPPFSQNRNLK